MKIAKENKIRYKLTPQMQEYDRLRVQWLPYLMFFQTPGHVSQIVNTDCQGFRQTYKNENIINTFNLPTDAKINLFIGGSTAFGVGATGDKKTIPSLLNEQNDDVWLNFGGRAYSSTQELLLFLFYHQNIKNIKKIVIFSGINNLVLFYLSSQYNKNLGAFFFNDFFQTSMNKQNLSKKQRMWQLLTGQIASIQKTNPGEKKKEDLINVLERDIYSWNILASALNIEICYVLQPMANWITKTFTKEETTLFSELDNYPQNHWRVIKDKLSYEQYKWFSEQLRDICQSFKIRFFDMNKAITEKKLNNHWLFVDRAHLTDEGNKISAEILEKEVLT